MSTVFPPNTQVPVISGGQPFDINFTSDIFGSTFTQMTYVAITSRSYHPGGANVFMMDGSCRFIKSSIAQQTWRVHPASAPGGGPKTRKRYDRTSDQFTLDQVERNMI
jgi:prepilin-type processing-associated H-X9-DG protein